MVRAKFRLSSIAHHEGDTTSLKFYAINDDSTEENRRFTKYTPSGSLEVMVTNKDVLEQFMIGKSYYVDFTPADVLQEAE